MEADIIDNLAALLRQRESGIADKELLNELRTYVIDEKGSYNAQSGCYDDRVMAYAIALHGLASMPRPKRLEVKRSRCRSSVRSGIATIL